MIVSCTTTAPKNEGTFGKTSIRKVRDPLPLCELKRNEKIKEINKFVPRDEADKLHINFFMQNDLRCLNLSHLELKDKDGDLTHVMFDTGTQWPKDMPSVFFILKYCLVSGKLSPATDTIGLLGDSE